MRLRTKLLAATALVVSFGMVDQAYAISLKDAVNLVLTTNPEVGVTVKDRRAIDYELRQARGLYYPQIDVTYQAGPEYSENDSVDFGNDREGPHDHGRGLFRRDGRVTLSQLLFDGFATDSEVERQQSRVVSAAHRIQDQSQVSALDAVQAYIDVLRHRDRVKVAQDNIQAHLMTLGLVQKRAELGGGNIADVRQAEARLATARTSLKQIEGDLRESEATFERVIGQPASNLESVELLPSALAPTVEAAVTRGIDRNPRVRLAKADIDVAEAEIRQMEAPFYPDLRLQLSGATATDVNGIEETTYNAAAQVVATYNLYRGGIDEARVKEAKERRSEALERLRLQQRQVAEEVRISWSQWQTQTNRVGTLTDQVTANQRTRDVYLQQFDIGQRSLLDLLDSTNELFLAKEGLVNANYLRLFANYRILASTGELVQTLGVSFPTEGTPAELDYNAAGQALPKAGTITPAGKPTANAAPAKPATAAPVSSQPLKQPTPPTP